ncbi:glycine-rich protein DC7.1-like [Alnus glutinosa]|uniref:glycine-rich protein DC7.1-like n=1 Tax=Alnus glutinosa TaxID=3517 RepID=UPI002D784928|nr:glycine-rich protein DC7.1-like [Alnus glutinosa]
MGSKAFPLLGLLLAVIVLLIISSEVAAKDLAQTSFYPKNVEATKESNDGDDARDYEFDYHSGLGGKHSCENGCCNYNYESGGRCRRCCP